MVASLVTGIDEGRVSYSICLCDLVSRLFQSDLGLFWCCFSCKECISHWSFVKTSVKQNMERKVYSNFQMSFFNLSQMAPIVEVSGQVDIFVISLGQADLWSDVPPSRASSGQEWY